MFFIDMGASLFGIQKALAVYSHPAPWIPLLYAAVLSSGVAFTLQIVAQNKIRPTVASLLMSLESVFAVISGWIVLGERLTFQEIFGCLLMFTAVILAQINLPQKN
jgi:drug/metabolite transporter (DMT)-like permease